MFVYKENDWKTDGFIKNDSFDLRSILINLRKFYQEMSIASYQCYFIVNWNSDLRIQLNEVVSFESIKFWNVVSLSWKSIWLCNVNDAANWLQTNLPKKNIIWKYSSFWHLFNEKTYANINKYQHLKLMVNVIYAIIECK